jgi:ATPase subunit of ABC transporter with duplicated ATPase domains
VCALKHTQGTVLAVSHDRYFLRKIATRVLELRDGNMQDYTGDYECACMLLLPRRRRRLKAGCC